VAVYVKAEDLPFSSRHQWIDFVAFGVVYVTFAGALILASALDRSWLASYETPWWVLVALLGSMGGALGVDWATKRRRSSARILTQWLPFREMVLVVGAMLIVWLALLDLFDLFVSPATGRVFAERAVLQFGMGVLATGLGGLRRVQKDRNNLGRNLPKAERAPGKSSG
jgi:hypothetical protein